MLGNVSDVRSDVFHELQTSVFVVHMQRPSPMRLVVLSVFDRTR